VQDILVALVLASAAKIWVKLWSVVAERGWLRSTLTRKLIHTGTGPLFVAGWVLFSGAPTAILTACGVPVINLVRLWLAARDKTTNAESSALVSALSRSGAAAEVKKGPFYYTLVLLAATVCSFRALPGAIAVCQMAVGDGLADIVGRRLGRTKWGFVANKTVEGSLAFVIGAFASSLGMLALFRAVGYTTVTIQAAILPLCAISVACAAVELLSAPLRRLIGEYGDDNITVPLIGGILTALFLHS
jgi:dolichol kinase